MSAVGIVNNSSPPVAKATSIGNGGVSSLPPGFDPVLYVHPLYNPDLANKGLKASEAAQHWLDKGRYENRRYKAYNPADPFNLLPADFTWHGYLECNPDLFDKGVRNQVTAVNHWLKTGCYQQLEYQPVVKKYAIIAISHGGGGGLPRHTRDLIDQTLHDSRSLNYDIYCNEQKYEKYSTVKCHSSSYLLSLLQSNELLKYDKVVVHLHCFSQYYYLYSVNDYIAIVNAIRRVANSHIIITIHDYSWFWPLCYAPAIGEVRSLAIEKGRVVALNKLFDKCDRVIFATQTSLDNYIARGIKRGKSIVVAGHPDYDTASVLPYYQQIRYNHAIKILFLGELERIKGYNFFLDVFKTTTFYDHIELHLLGDGNQANQPLPNNITVIKHGRYQDTKVFEQINHIQPHLCLLSSTCYETWGYTATIMLKTGLPLFYHQVVYKERIAERANAYPYSGNAEKVGQSLIKCLRALRAAPNQRLYRPVDPASKMVYSGIYEQLYLE